MFKVIIAGSRDFLDYELLKAKCDKILSNKLSNGTVEIVSGGARGADALGERYARERNLPIKVFKADWDTHGKSAGFIRNADMADYAEALIAFDRGSSGTGHMVKLATQKGLAVRHIKVK